jgi:hypothetical protein
VAVVQAGGEGVLGREPVVDGRDNDPELVGEPPAQLVVLPRRPADVPTAVNPQESRSGFAPSERRGVHAHAGVTDRHELDSRRRPAAPEAFQVTTEPEHPLAAAPRQRLRDVAQVRVVRRVAHRARHLGKSPRY